MTYIDNPLYRKGTRQSSTPVSAKPDFQAPIRIGTSRLFFWIGIDDFSNGFRYLKKGNYFQAIPPFIFCAFKLSVIALGVYGASRFFQKEELILTEANRKAIEQLKGLDSSNAWIEKVADSNLRADGHDFFNSLAETCLDSKTKNQDACRSIATIFTNYLFDQMKPSNWSEKDKNIVDNCLTNNAEFCLQLEENIIQKSLKNRHYSPLGLLRSCLDKKPEENSNSKSCSTIFQTILKNTNSRNSPNLNGLVTLASKCMTKPPHPYCNAIISETTKHLIDIKRWGEISHLMMACNRKKASQGVCQNIVIESHKALKNAWEEMSTKGFLQTASDFAADLANQTCLSIAKLPSTCENLEKTVTVFRQIFSPEEKIVEKEMDTLAFNLANTCIKNIKDSEVCPDILDRVIKEERMSTDQMSELFQTLLKSNFSDKNNLLEVLLNKTFIAAKGKWTLLQTITKKVLQNEFLAKSKKLGEVWEPFLNHQDVDNAIAIAETVLEKKDTNYNSLIKRTLEVLDQEKRYTDMSNLAEKALEKDHKLYKNEIVYSIDLLFQGNKPTTTYRNDHGTTYYHTYLEESPTELAQKLVKVWYWEKKEWHREKDDTTLLSPITANNWKMKLDV
jgi:hypothetical protein